MTSNGIGQGSPPPPTFIETSNDTSASLTVDVVVDEEAGRRSPSNVVKGVAFHPSTQLEHHNQQQQNGGDNRSRTGSTSSGTTSAMTGYEARAKAGGMRYTLTEIPPPVLSVLLGLQHYFTMIGAAVIIPLIICPPMGASPKQTAECVSTILFASGINTLLQTTVGTRLPIVQGGSFAFLTPVFLIIGNDELQSIEDTNERFHVTMRTVQGAVLVCGFVQVLLGYSGLITPLFKYISPITIACVISIMGFSLYNIAFNNISTCFPLGLIELFLIVLFSQYLKKISVLGYPVFSLFPVILAILLTWIYGTVMTAADVWDEGSLCRTDGTRDLVNDAPWFQIPYPLQWGSPIFKGYAIFPMLGSMFASMIESIGDYYICASLAGAPPPTPGVITRGLASEGLGLVVCGMFGTGNGTTSYSENIGAMSLTRVGSRVVIQCGAITAIILACFGKIMAVIASIPTAMAGGVYCVLFALIAAVGLSSLQHINLNSERNLFVIGFSLFNALSIAGPSGYFSSQNGNNPFGSSNLGEIAYSLFSSPIVVVLMLSMFLDNTIPGTRKERGVLIWSRVSTADVNNDPEYVKAYSLPLCFAKLFRNCSYLEYGGRGAFPDPPMNGYRSGRGDVGELFCPCMFPRIGSSLEEEGDNNNDGEERNE